LEDISNDTAKTQRLRKDGAIGVSQKKELLGEAKAFLGGKKWRSARRSYLRKRERSSGGSGKEEKKTSSTGGDVIMKNGEGGGGNSWGGGGGGGGGEKSILKKVTQVAEEGGSQEKRSTKKCGRNRVNSLQGKKKKLIQFCDEKGKSVQGPRAWQ